MLDDVSFLLADALALPGPRFVPSGAGDYVLPPLVQEDRLSSRTIEAVARLYLFAELETAAVVVCADAVFEARASLRTSYALASRLERYAEVVRQSPTAAEREGLYARFFGIGRNAAGQERGNHAFLAQLAGLCGLLAGLGADRPLDGPSRTFDEERARTSLEQLLSGLASRTGGDLLSVQRIAALVAAAVEVLSDPELGALLGARGFAGVVQMLVGGEAVDLPLAFRRGRSGQTVLEDCGRLLPRLRSGGRFVDASDPILRHAVVWLASYGMGPGGPR